MDKRNATPLSVNRRKKFYVKAIPKRPRKYTSDETNKLILPILKDNSDQKKMKAQNQKKKKDYL